jgi:hypothetical protein
MGKPSVLKNIGTSLAVQLVKPAIKNLGEQDFLYGKEPNDSNLTGVLQDFHV